jgi:prevent-host-death family protein
MQAFSLTKLNRTASEVLDAAHRGPIALTQRGKTKFVLMPADHYERMLRPNAQRAIDLKTASAEDLKMIADVIDADQG